MELLQLKYFCDAAASENFSKTAKKFGVPASDISQSVRRLERELGISLFIRRANKIELNDKGREFYLRVSEALALIEDATAAVKDIEGAGKIKICINSNRRIVMEVVEKYSRIYPDVEIETAHLANPAVDSFDIIIDSGEDSIAGYDKKLLITEPIMLAVNADSELSRLEKIDVSGLEGEPFITLSEKSSLYSTTNSICRDFGFSPKIAIKSDDPLYVRKCVELSIGICFAPAFSWRGQFSDKVVLKNIEGYTRNTYIFTASKKHMPLCARRFCDMLVEEVSNQIIFD